MERGRAARPFLLAAHLLADALELGERARTELMSALYGDADVPAFARTRDGVPSRGEVPCQLPAVAVSAARVNTFRVDQITCAVVTVSQVKGTNRNAANGG